MKIVTLVNKETSEAFEFSDNTLYYELQNGKQLMITQALKVVEIEPIFEHRAFENVEINDVTDQYTITVAVQKSYLCKVFVPVVPSNPYNTETKEFQHKIVMAYNETECVQKIKEYFGKSVKMHIEQVHETV